MSDSSVMGEGVAPFDSITTILVRPMANLTVMLYIYGIYTVIFAISLRILIHRGKHPNRVLYMFFTTVLFTLTSAYNVVATFIYAKQATREFTFTKNQDWAAFLAYLEHDNVKTTLAGFEEFLPLFLDCGRLNAAPPLLCAVELIQTDCISNDLPYGFTSWQVFPQFGCIIQLILALVPVCEIVACAFRVVGISNTADPAKVELYFQGNAINTAFWPAEMGVNIILTLLTAGRIWWVSQRAQKHTGPATETRYKMIVAIILDSGILYPIFLIADVIYNSLADPDGTGLLPFSLSVVLYQVAGIAPTLIIIRAVSGKTVEHTSTNQAMSSVHFAESAGPGSRNSNTRSHIQTVDIEVRVPAEGAKNPGKEKAA
ncbi:hypothetical protein WG66_013053 [Moniliophthora roreri]|uniref:Uncharacterized protein n=1 Tax=Moniliophthora roreri TaxID=221103 RepID=A0A0W0G155_MONRR|nr:hypothetical protein WG66_013053 [Moniliophthora roreri]